jgi:hypothetical protein
VTDEDGRGRWNGATVHIPAYALVAILGAGGGYFAPRIVDRGPDNEGIPVQTSRYVTSERLDRALHLHTLQPHPTGASSREIMLLEARIERIEKEVVLRIERLEDRWEKWIVQQQQISKREKTSE